jgi:membrane-associated protease RseP (regulator of RpoE activity)
MVRLLLLPILLVAVLLSGASAQTPDRSKPDLTPLGMRLSAVPELLYDQIPQLKRGEGAVVEEVQPGSAAAQAGFRRHDIVLSYRGQTVRSADHFYELIRSSPADHGVALVLLRGGQTTPLEVTLAQTAAAGLNSPRAMLKSVGPPAVNVEAQRLEGGKLQVTFIYYSQGTGKLERVKCSGSIAEIENEVRELGKQNRMPSRVQDLVDVALRRIRVLDIPAKN